jgi:nucleoside 2-deoxyribosyltransferase
MTTLETTDFIDTVTPEAQPPRKPRVFLPGPEIYLFDARVRDSMLADIEISLGVTRKKLITSARTQTLAPAAAAGKVKIELCEKYGFDGVFPLNPDFANIGKKRSPQEAAEETEKLMRECDLIIANCTPFRGAHMDPGVAFAIGFMRALGKPTYGYTTTRIAYDRRVTLHRMRPRAPYDCDISREFLIEPYGLVENVLIEGGMEVAIAQDFNRESKVTGTEAFEACLKAAHEKFGTTMKPEPFIPTVGVTAEKAAAAI